MKCPHCHRAWAAGDIDAPLSPTLVLEEHVRRFCPGVPVHEQRPRRKAVVARR
jgi:hypothetical protein